MTFARKLASHLALPALVAVLCLAVFDYAKSVGSSGAHFAVYAAGIAGWLSLAWLSARVVDLVLAATPQAPRLLNDLLHAVIYVVAVIAILVFVFEREATGLIATSSVLIAVIGFGLRNVISDTFSGIALSFDHPYRIGDWVEPANGVFGKVTEITWRTTRLITRDGTVVIVPNGVIANGRLVNYSAPNPSYRISLRFWLDARLPVERTKRLLYMGALRAMRGYPDLRPDVLVQETGDSGVLYLVRFWVIDGADENTCRDTVLSAVMRMLQREGIILQAPRRDMAFIQREEEAVPTLEPATHDSVLDHCDLFKLFGEEERMQMARTLVEHRFEKGDVVFNRGAPGGTLFIVADGALEVLSPETGLSKKAVLDRMVPGDVFGEISLLTGEPRSATVQAMTDAICYEVTKEAFEPFLWQRPDLFDRLAALMVERQRHNKNVIPLMAAKEEKAAKEDLASRIRKFFARI